MFYIQENISNVLINRPSHILTTRSDVKFYSHAVANWRTRFLLHYKQAVRVETQYASAPCKLTISSYLFARWLLFRHVGYLRHQQEVDLWPFWPWKWCPSHVWRGLPLCQF